MNFHGGFGDAEAVSDQLVRLAKRYAPNNFDFPFAERHITCLCSPRLFSAWRRAPCDDQLRKLSRDHAFAS